MKEFYVVPESDVEECKAIHQDQDQCNTLAFYMNCSCSDCECNSSYFNSHEIYTFWKGIHSPLFNETLPIQNVENLTFRVNGDDNRAIIDCNGESAGFVFNESSDIKLENLVFLSCVRTESLGAAESSHHALATLAFHNGANLYLTNVTLNGSVDEALYVHNIGGVIRFEQVVVINSKSNVHRNTNVIYNSKCNNESLQINITNSVFSGNYNDKPKSSANHDANNIGPNSVDSYPLAAGLSITLKCLSVNILIENVTMRDNHGGNGGNLALVFHNTSSTPDNIVTIRNCTLESGTAVTGGGLFVEFVDSSKSEESLCLLSHHKSEHQLLVVENTTFKNNSAVYAGGAVYLKQKQSKASCSVGGISFVNCKFHQNFVTRKGFGGTALHSINYPIATYKHRGVPQFKIVVESCDFWENYAEQQDVIQSGNGAIFSKADSYFKLINVTIRNNTSSGILAIGSNIILSGNISIKDNWASSGGGMLLCQNAIIYFHQNTSVNISHNRVVHTGGGISVETQCLQSRPMCFFQLAEKILQYPESIDSLHVHIHDNLAGFAGHNLFGGSVDHCFMLDGPDHKPYSNQSIDVFKSIFHIPTKGKPSSITSEPHHVCVCNKTGQPNCKGAAKNYKVYPGQPFTITAVLVGQLHGIVPGTVLAQISDHSSATFKHEEKVQKLGRNSSCGSLTYTIYANDDSEVELLLNAQHSGDVSGYEQLNQLTKLKLNVKMKKCPAGFALFENNGTISCDCVAMLKDQVACKIADNLIERKNPYWIGYDESTNATLFHSHCPFDYCVNRRVLLKAKRNSINQDAQCANHRTGIICGACTGDRSVVMGSNDCQNCSNYWLFMLVIIAFSGVLLVLMLSKLNITITEGTLGGVLFYCNIINSNSTYYFQGEPVCVITPLLKGFVSLLSLSVGGTSMCLYNGMDAYGFAWLSFAYPFYIWFIAGLIVCLGHKFNWVVRHNSVKVLATLIILSYSNLLASVIIALQATYLHQEGGGSSFRWLKDGNIRYFHGKHIPLVIFASLLGLILLPFTFCLLCIQCLLKVSHHKMFSWVNHLKPFFDAYTGPFTAQARFWTGLLLLARMIVYIHSAVNYSGRQEVETIGMVGIISFVLLFTTSVLKGGLYKRRFLSIIEYSLLFNLGMLSTYTAIVNNVQQNIVTTHVSVGIVFFTFVGIILYHVKFFKRIRWSVRRLWLRAAVILSMKRSLRSDYPSDEEDQYDTTNFPPLAEFDQTREPLLD